MFTELSRLQVLEGYWLELRNSKGNLLGMYGLVEDERIANEFIALDPIVLESGDYEVTIFNDSTPVLDDYFSVRTSQILFGYTIDYRPERIVSVTKHIFHGTEDQWYNHLGMD